MARDPLPFDRRIAATYHEAMRSAHDGARTTIHVGRDVWQALRDLATEAGVIPGATLFGFTVILETSYAPQTIEVKTTRVIV